MGAGGSTSRVCSSIVDPGDANGPALKKARAAGAEVPKKQAHLVYKTLDKLGAGASCSVLKVQSTSDQSKYAMKVLVKSQPDNAMLFKQELKILSMLKHPNVLEYVEAFEDDESYHIVTVLCEGGELFDRVSDGSFSEADASALTRQMLLALSHLHDLDVEHRDLKPENFVFETRDKDSNMKLIDFGCAVNAGNRDIVDDVAGSPYYVAPEVLDKKAKRTGAVWKASDMWSIGVIVFLLVHGYPPFNGETQAAIFTKIKKGRYRINPKLELSREVKGFIKGLLNQAPDQRMTAHEALKHPWIADKNAAPTTPLPSSIVTALQNFHKQMKLKKAVGKMLAGNMTSADKEVLQSVFERFDKNGDGKLSGEEIAEMLKYIGRPPEEADAVLQEFDDDNSGAIEFNEFKNIHGAGQNVDEKEAQQLFEKFDADKSGKVSMGELEQMLQIDSEEARSIIAEVDQNNDGEIDFEEFAKAIQVRKERQGK